MERSGDGWWNKEAEKTRGSLERRCDELGAVAAPIGTAGGECALTVGMWTSSVLGLHRQLC